LSILTGWKTAL